MILEHLSTNMEGDELFTSAGNTDSTTSTQETWENIYVSKDMVSTTTDRATLQYGTKSWFEIDYEVAKWLYRIYPPILMLMAAVGNGLSLTVMLRKNMRASTTCVFLASLAVTDTLVIFTGCLSRWLRTLSGGMINPIAWAECKIYYFVFYLGCHSSAFLLVAVTMDRFICIYFPSYSSNYLTIKRAAVIIVCILLSVALINGFHFMALEKVEFGNMSFCLATSSFMTTFLTQNWPLIDACLYSFVPSFVILILNTFIVAKMILSKLAMQQSEGINSVLAKLSGRTTRMLLLVTTVYIVTTYPLVITFLVNGYKGVYIPESVFALFEILMYLNHSCNFLLYCVSGYRFKDELKKMCFCSH